MSLNDQMQDELSASDSEVEKRTIKTKYVAKAAANYISQNYRCTAGLNNELSAYSCPEGEFALLISPDYQDATDEYVERFNRISFDSPVGTCTLQLEYHAAFGVCRFSYYKN